VRRSAACDDVLMCAMRPNLLTWLPGHLHVSLDD
jgi:hypothetical protein